MVEVALLIARNDAQAIHLASSLATLSQPLRDPFGRNQGAPDFDRAYAHLRAAGRPSMLTASRADPCDSPATVPAHSQEVMRIQRGHVLPAVRVMHIQAALLPW